MADCIVTYVDNYGQKFDAECANDLAGKEAFMKHVDFIRSHVLFMLQNNLKGSHEWHTYVTVGVGMRVIIFSYSEKIIIG